MGETECRLGIGNPWCDAGKQAQLVAAGLDPDALCNEAWNTDALNRFCGDSYATATWGELESSLVFPTGTDHERGLLFLHLLSHQMKLAQGTDFVFMVRNLQLD